MHTEQSEECQRYSSSYNVSHFTLLAVLCSSNPKEFISRPTSSILLDCGEGTLGQIIRFYGTEKATTILRNLKAIYVSHLHADHHLGLIGILEERRRLLQGDTSPVMLLAPKQISSFLDFYDKRIDSIRNEYFLVPNANLVRRISMTQAL